LFKCSNMLGSKSKGGNRIQSLWERCLGSFLLVLWVIPSFNNAFAAETPRTDISQSTLTSSSSVLLSDDFDTLSSHPFTPDLPDPVPIEPDEPEDVAQEDNLVDDSIILCRFYIIHTNSREKAQAAQLKQSLQNRKTVPLFILFHSWKSFSA
jgi:hypothetical protein